MDAEKTRGESALARRESALQDAKFPAYPEEPNGAIEDFTAPTVENTDAAPSARKWQLSQQLATLASDLMQRRRKELEGPLPRRYHPTPSKPAGHGADDHKRMRRPTAIMRSNVEVARMMGVPGSKQRHLNANDIEAEKEQPQHLCSARPRHPEGKAAKQPPAVDDSEAKEGGGGSGTPTPRGRPGRKPKTPAVAEEASADAPGQSCAEPSGSERSGGERGERGSRVHVEQRSLGLRREAWL